MKDVAQTEYAAHPELYSEWVDSSTGITDGNYFYVASKYRLGTAQAAQFQSGNQNGESWYWGSKCTAPGVCDNSNSIALNELSIMPRSLLYDEYNPNDMYYNHPAAVAESLSASVYQEGGASALDSICPSGWKLPEVMDLKNTFITSYELSFDSISSVEFSRRLPLSLYAKGYITHSRGFPIAQESQTRIWSSTINNTADGFKPPIIFMARENNDGTITYNGASAGNFAYGLTMHCVKR